jgi:hypothetical protein
VLVSCAANDAAGRKIPSDEAATRAASAEDLKSVIDGERRSLESMSDLAGVVEATYRSFRS